ncbi:unnamed protein product [Linum trigynum]|uniref:Uncharacterized protein n=1 Tax=Linum trigynum TaxID=586398 RepID=A0AAV2GE88_9ROSI
MSELMALFLFLIVKLQLHDSTKTKVDSLSTRSCGLGINLATADTVILYASLTKASREETTEEALDLAVQRAKSKGLCKTGDFVVALH